MKNLINKYFFKKIAQNHDLYIWMALLLSLAFILVNIPPQINKLLHQNHTQINNNKVNFDYIATFESVTKSSDIEKMAKKYNFSYEQINQKDVTNFNESLKLNVDYQIINKDHTLKNQKFLISSGVNLKNENEVLIQPQLLQQLHLNIGEYLNINNTYLKIVGTYVTSQTILKQSQNLNQNSQLTTQIIVNNNTFNEIKAPNNNLTYLKFNKQLTSNEQKSVFEKIKNDKDFSLQDQISLFKYNVEKLNYNESTLCDNETKFKDMLKWGQMTQNDFVTLSNMAINKDDINSCLKNSKYLKNTKEIINKVISDVNNVKNYLSSKQENASLKNASKFNFDELLKHLTNKTLENTIVLSFTKDNKEQNINEQVNGNYLVMQDNKLTLNLNSLIQEFTKENEENQANFQSKLKTFNATIRIPNGYQIKYFTLLKNYQLFNKTQTSNILLKEQTFLTSLLNVIILILIILVIVMLQLVINKTLNQNYDQFQILKKIGISNKKLLKPFLTMSVFISTYLVIWTLILNQVIENLFKWYLENKYNLINYNFKNKNFMFMLVIYIICVYIITTLYTIILTKYKLTQIIKNKLKSKTKNKTSILTTWSQNKFITLSSAFLIFVVTSFSTIIIVMFINLQQNFYSSDKITTKEYLNVYENKSTNKNMNVFTSKYELNNVYNHNKVQTSNLKNDFKSLDIIAFTAQNQTNLKMEDLTKGLILPKSYASKYNLKINQELELNTPNGLKKFKIVNFSNKLNDRYLYTSTNYLQQVFLTEIINNAKDENTINKNASFSINFKILNQNSLKEINQLFLNLLIIVVILFIIIGPLVGMLNDALIQAKIKNVKILKLIGLSNKKVANLIYKPYYILTIVISFISVIVTQIWITPLIVKLVFLLLGFEITYVDSILTNSIVFVGIILMHFIYYKWNIFKINQVSKKLLKKGL